MATHVNRLVSSSFYQLRRIRTIRRSLPTTTAITLINSFVISRVDYCNSLLCGLHSYQLARIQSVLNAAARIIYGGKRSDHVTLLLRDRLHWLGVPERVRFKLCLMVWLSTIWHRNTLLTVASRCPTQHVELVSGRHLATCWTSREQCRTRTIRRTFFRRRWSSGVERTARQRERGNIWICELV